MDYEELEVEILHVTDSAILCRVDGVDEDVWIPFSQIEDNGEELKKGYVGPIYATTWVCVKKGLT